MNITFGHILTIIVAAVAFGLIIATLYSLYRDKKRDIKESSIKEQQPTEGSVSKGEPCVRNIVFMPDSTIVLEYTNGLDNKIIKPKYPVESSYYTNNALGAAFFVQMAMGNLLVESACEIASLKHRLNILEGNLKGDKRE